MMIGDRIHHIMADRFGVQSCAECNEDVMWLNGLSAQQARANIGRIVDRIGRRWRKLPGWRRWAVGVGLHVPGVQQWIKSRVRRVVDQAIEAEPASDFFDRVVVINLDRRPDRLQAFEATLETRGWPFARPQRVAAIDGQIDQPPAWWRASAGAWGNYKTQLQVIEQAIADGVKTLLILEDDATWLRTIADNARQVVAELPDDWECLYLGGQHVGSPLRLVSPHLVAVHPGAWVERTHAWALRGAGLVKVRDHLRSIGPDSVPHYLGKWVPVLHRRGDLRVYAAHPWLIGQAGGRSDIARHDSPERWWPASAHAPAPRRWAWLDGLRDWFVRSWVLDALVTVALVLLSPLIVLAILWSWLRQWRIVRVRTPARGLSRVTGYRRSYAAVNTLQAGLARRRRRAAASKQRSAAERRSTGFRRVVGRPPAR